MTTTYPCPWTQGALLACTCVLVGCGGQRFGSELGTRPKTRPLSRMEGSAVRLPEGKPFAIAVPQASKKPGLEGTAEADARASGSGTADASATISFSGTAEGSFQLGDAFENDTPRQTDFDFTVRFHYAFEAEAHPASAYPDATVGLNLYARDGRGRLLRELKLIDYSTEHGPARGESHEDRQFTLTLGPGESVNVFLAGRVRVDIREGRSAHGSLRLTGLQMEVATRPAPDVAPSGDEQE